MATARHRRSAALYAVQATRFLHDWLPQSFFTPRVKLELTKLPPDKSATSKSLAAVGVSGSHTRVHTNATHITHITHTHITHTYYTHVQHILQTPPNTLQGGERALPLYLLHSPRPYLYLPFSRARARSDLGSLASL